jgi:hypothetical protein
VLLLGPQEQRSTYERIIVAVMRYSAVVNYTGAVEIPLLPRHPASSSSSASTAASQPTPVVTPDFPKKTKCISYVRQDQVYTHMIDVMSELSINSSKIIQELNHYIISLLHSDVGLKGLYNDQTITMKT